MIFLKDEIMDDVYGNGNEEKRKNFRCNCIYYVFSQIVVMYMRFSFF